MRPTQHPSNNDVLLPPAGSTRDECRPLPITRVRYGNGMPGVWSFWEPSPEERAAIASGAMVRLCTMGSTHPPVVLNVDGLEGAAT